jgi:serine/threonine-protein kinase RsbW
MPERDQFSVTATATPEVLERAHDELDRLWDRRPDVSDRDRMRFETGLIEILGNIVEHAYRLGETTPPAAGDERQLTVEIDVTDEALRAVLSDNGRPAEVDLSAVTLPGEEAEDGRGLALALAALDSLEHERVEGRNRWTLLCERGS